MSAWINVPYWWHATLLEVLWLCSGTISALLTLVNLYDSWKDQASLAVISEDRSVHDRHFQMIKLAAHGRVSSQASRLAISALIMVTGGIGVTQPNPLGGHTTWTALTVTTCLVAIAVITAARSFFDYRQRNLLYELATKRSAVIAARLRAKYLNEED